MPATSAVRVLVPLSTVEESMSLVGWARHFRIGGWILGILTAEEDEHKTGCIRVCHTIPGVRTEKRKPVLLSDGERPKRTPGRFAVFGKSHNDY